MSPQTVWISECSKTRRHYALGASFPDIVDYVEFYDLDMKKLLKTISEEERKQWSDTVVRQEVLDHYWLGDYIPPNNMPNKLYKKPASEVPTADDVLFKIVGGYLIVNQTCAEVLRQHRLGKTHLSEVYVYDVLTREQLSDTPFYFLNIAETRSYFVPEYTEHDIRSLGMRNNKEWYQMIGPTKDDSYAIFEKAKETDVDIWIDPHLSRIVFMSDTLVNAFIAAGINKEDWLLYTCDLVQTH